ncbi:hypothetical protein [Butyrivibrio sp. JL13D10]|uniref:hypothetical protein n=1 Tax=Butyrivibrio sp. JL13D10 TaxID=3236815 RepID=UPI0038B66310
MKLKYYLRGLGVGVVLTAVIMGVVLGRNNSRISDEEVIKRARQLGMVEEESTLSSYSDTVKNPEVGDDADVDASDQKVDETGEKTSQEVNEGESQTGESVPEVDEKTQKNEALGENSESVESEEDVKLASNDTAAAASTDVIGTEKEHETGEENSSPDQKNQIKAEEKAAIEDASSSTSGNTDTSNDSETSNNTVAASNSETTNNTVATSNTETTSSTDSADMANTSSQEATPVSSDVNYVVVVLPSGSESDTCARILRESGIIEDGIAFNKYLVSSGQDRKIRSGTKQIPKGASFEEIASIITK